MSTALLDLNVLMALGWPSHEHHEPAHAWLHKHGKRRWATCPFTQVGFVRLSSNPLVVDPPTTPACAAQLLRKMTGHRGHVFWSDDLDIANDDWPPGWVQGHRQTTDAHLVRIARRHRAVLVTFDQALASQVRSGIELLQ